MIRRMFVRFCLLLFVLASGLAQAAGKPQEAAKPQTQAKPALVYILAGRLFDSTSDNVRETMVIVVEGDRIQAVKPATELRVPSGAKVIDLSRATVLPGLIDCHVHLDSRADRYNEIYKFKDTPFTEAFFAVGNARRTLEAGFTTVRDVGSRPFLAVDLRNSINEGFTIGPRIVASGPGISITGGHGDLNNFSPQTRVSMFPEERDFKIADGIDQVRHVVRAQVKSYPLAASFQKATVPALRNTRSKNSRLLQTKPTWLDAKSRPMPTAHKASRTRSSPALIRSSMPA